MTRIRAHAANIGYGIAYAARATWLCVRVMGSVAIEGIRQRKERTS